MFRDVFRHEDFCVNNDLRFAVEPCAIFTARSEEFDFDGHLDFSFSTWLAQAKKLQTQGVRSL